MVWDSKSDIISTLETVKPSLLIIIIYVILLYIKYMFKTYMFVSIVLANEIVKFKARKCFTSKV